MGKWTEAAKVAKAAQDAQITTLSGSLAEARGKVEQITALVNGLSSPTLSKLLTFLASIKNILGV